MRKLLIVTDEMEVGGTQRQIFQLLSNIDRERFSPHLLYFREHSHLVDALSAQGIKCTYIEKNAAVDFAFYRRFRRYLAQEDFDVVHAFAFSAELWTLLARMPRARGLFFSSIRGRYEWYKSWQWVLKSVVTLFSHGVISNSQAGLDYAAAHCPGLRSRAHLVYNGVDMAAVSPESKQETAASLPGTACSTGLFVGRLVDHKNLPCLLRALALLIKQDIAHRFLIVGEGPLQSEVQHHIDELQLGEHVFLLGQRDDVAELMQLSDYVVLPSWREGLSNTILEAMFNGRPVIASRAGGNIELLQHEQTGLLFDSNDEQQLADCILRLLNNKQFAATIGVQAQAQANEKFSVTSMVSSVESIYSEESA
jgi:glycosyltransferase involved in cell wall biosynthesis